MRTRSFLRSAVCAAALLASGAPPILAQAEFLIVGSPDAPVEMTVYSDFECPYCRNFALAAFPAIAAEFIDTGLLRLRFVYFPLSTIHSNAVASAKAAHCAGVAGRFWAYHDYLFVRQPEWRGPAAPDSVWIAYAENLGIDTAAFAECLDAKATIESVEAGWMEAVSFGAQGTPTIVLNGEALAELGSYEQLRERVRAAIDAAGREASSARQ